MRELPAGQAGKREPMQRSEGESPGTLPVFLRVAGKDCLVVGGGRVARRRVESLLLSGASVTVVSPLVAPDLAADPPPHLRIVRRAYQPSDLEGTFLAIAATDDRDVNRRVVEDAQARGVLVGSVEADDRADFTFGSVIRRAGLTVGISTGGRSPAYTRWLREEIERFLSPEYLDLLAVVAEVRAKVRSEGVSPDRETWRSCFTEDLLDLIRQGRPDEARARLREALLPREGL